MRPLIISVSLLALMAPTAYAQQVPKPASAQPGAPVTTPGTVAAQTETARFLVFFDWDKAALTTEARQVVAKAADEFKRTGAARLVATGYTDLSGTPQYNYKLSVRHAER